MCDTIEHSGLLGSLAEEQLLSAKSVTLIVCIEMPDARRLGGSTARSCQVGQLESRPRYLENHPALLLRIKSSIAPNFRHARVFLRAIFGELLGFFACSSVAVSLLGNLK